jgi:hypothetical protein
MGETPQYPHGHGSGAGPHPQPQPLWQPHPGAHQPPAGLPGGPPASRPHAPARPARTGLVAGITGVGALAVGLLVGSLVLPHSDGTLPDPESAAPGEFEIAGACQIVRTLDGEFSQDDDLRLDSASLWRAGAAGQLLLGADSAYPEYSEFAEAGRDLTSGVGRLDPGSVDQGVVGAMTLCEQEGL